MISPSNIKPITAVGIVAKITKNTNFSSLLNVFGLLIFLKCLEVPLKIL